MDCQQNPFQVENLHKVIIALLPSHCLYFGMHLSVCSVAVHARF